MKINQLTSDIMQIVLQILFIQKKKNKKQLRKEELQEAL